MSAMMMFILSLIGGGLWAGGKTADVMGHHSDIKLGREQLRTQAKGSVAQREAEAMALKATDKRSDKAYKRAKSEKAEDRDYDREQQNLAMMMQFLTQAGQSAGDEPMPQNPNVPIHSLLRR